MLNVLLSFAQFEREMTSERTKDKQSAARKKGKWTGGPLVLDYDLDPRNTRLLINAEEAERLRSIFHWYLEGESVFSIMAKITKSGWRNKQWTTRGGAGMGETPMTRVLVVEDYPMNLEPAPRLCDAPLSMWCMPIPVL
jgi:site-specific DNA recombinase